MNQEGGEEYTVLTIKSRNLNLDMHLPKGIKCMFRTQFISKGVVLISKSTLLCKQKNKSVYMKTKIQTEKQFVGKVTQ